MEKYKNKIIGNGWKAVSRETGKAIGLNLSINYAELQKLSSNDKGYVTVNVYPSKSEPKPGKKMPDYIVSVKNEESSFPAATPAKKKAVPEEDLPF